MSLNLADPVYVRQAAMAAFASQLRRYSGAAGRVVHVSSGVHWSGSVDLEQPDPAAARQCLQAALEAPPAR